MSQLRFRNLFLSTIENRFMTVMVLATGILGETYWSGTEWKFLLLVETKIKIDGASEHSGSSQYILHVLCHTEMTFIICTITSLDVLLLILIKYFP